MRQYHPVIRSSPKEAPGWKLQEWRHRERTSATKATAEQVQEALQQLQAQGARIAALETQLRIDSVRAQTAEQERSTLIQTLVTTLSKGSEKGKKGSSGSGKGSKGQNNTSNVKCWNCGKSGHYWCDCKERRSARDSAEYCLRDEQVEASVIDEVGALLAEECDSKSP